MVASKHNVVWKRKHDRADRFLTAATVFYPTGLRDLIEICSNPPGKLKAAGSHFALSGAAISDEFFIETNDPWEDMPAMARTLHDVLPGCMSTSLRQVLRSADPVQHYPIHVEAGKRLYQLYSELDWAVGWDPKSLARDLKDRENRPEYSGRWALPTMGSAAKQTVVGAFSTGTHGGDVDLPPIADAIEAIHLVVDGGRHFWIERFDRGAFGCPLVDDASLRGFYNEADYGREVEIIRDNELFDAVLVSAGRFGVIYSVVIAAIPQFTLREQTELSNWKQVKAQIKGRRDPLWLKPQSTERTHYLNVIVSLSPCAGGSSNSAGIIRRWKVPGLSRAGVVERRGDPGSPPVMDLRTQSVIFPQAGRSHAYSGDPSPSMIEKACAASGLIQGLIVAMVDEVEEFVTSNGEVVGAGIAGVALAGGGGLILLIPQLALIVIIIREFLEHFDFDDSTVGDVAEAFRVVVMGAIAETGLPAPTFIWRLFTERFFASQLNVGPREAVSYAIMDTHDYRDRNCYPDVDSLEVFFDEDDSAALAYIDALIAFEKRQQGEGKTFFGVAALRFMNGTQALLGPQQWPRTVSIEVAGLQGVDGTRQLMNYASWLATDLNFRGILHWGQRNDSSATTIRRRFERFSDKFRRWQQQLRRLTADGDLDHFSNRQTRAWGLEAS